MDSCRKNSEEWPERQCCCECGFLAVSVECRCGQPKPDGWPEDRAYHPRVGFTCLVFAHDGVTQPRVSPHGVCEGWTPRGDMPPLDKLLADHPEVPHE